MSSKYTFLQKVDQLPTSQDWIYDSVTITGDTLGEDGDALTEQLDLWRRNPVECIQELIGNPAFREVMQYSPERVYAYQEGDVRIFDEMWTGEWWWNKQVSLT